MIFQLLAKRQFGLDDGDMSETPSSESQINEPPPPDAGFFSPSAFIIKWSIICAIFFALFLCLLSAYVHVRIRLQQGLPPLRYHRFLVRAKLERDTPAEDEESRGDMEERQQVTTYRPSYGLDVSSDPPPSYDHNDMPPVYRPATGNSHKSSEIDFSYYVVATPGLALPPATHLHGR